MQEKEYMYDAFISYRHTPLDIYMAEKLHTMLEHFKLPKFADKSAIEKTRIERVFRDKDELPVSDNLSESIREALEKSRYLIVICSKNTPESKWVEREIELFSQMHGRDKILAVLIEGEPEEAFPYALCHETDPVTGEVKEVEPLAADVRASSKRQQINALKGELLRLVAPILSCKYDDLKQRHKEYKFRRTLAWGTVIGIILMCIGAVSTIQAVRISRQADEITRLFASEEASKADALYEEGKRTDAIAKAVDAMDRLKEGEYIPAVHKAMAGALRVYDTGMVREPWSQIKMQGIITAADISTDAQYIAAVDEVGNISVWSTFTGDNVFNYKMRCDSTSLGVFEDGLRFVDERTCVYIGANERGCINVETGEVHSEESDFFGRIYAFSDNLSYLLITDGTDLQLYKTDSMESVFQIDEVSLHDDEGAETRVSGITGGLAASDNGKFISFGTMSMRDESADLYVIDVSEGKELFRKDLDYNYPKHAHISDDGSGMMVSKNTLEKGSFLSDSEEMYLFYDIEGDEVNKQEAYGTVSAKPETKDGCYIITSGTKLMLYNMQTGEKIYEADVPSKIQSVRLSDSEYAMCFVTLADGSIEVVTKSSDESYKLSELVSGGRRDMLLVVPSYDGQGYLAVSNGSNEAYLYVKKTSDLLEEIASVNSYISGTILDETNNRVAMHSMSDGSIAVCDLGADAYPVTYIEAKQFENDKLVDAMNGKNYLSIGFADINVYEWDGDVAVATLEHDYVVSSYFCKSDQCVYVSDDYEIKAYALPDLREIRSIPLEMVENYVVFNGGATMAYQDYYGDFHVLQIESNQDTLLDCSAGVMIVAPDEKSFAVNDRATNFFRIYNSKGEEIAACENESLLVKSFGYSDDGRYFFAEYTNGEFIVMDAESLTEVSRVSGIDATISTMKKIESLDKWALISREWYGEEGYILSEGFELDTKIDILFDVTQDGHIICGNSSTLYVAPYLSDSELRVLADKK